MAFISIPDTWRVAIEYTNLDANTAYNIIHVRDELGTMSLSRAADLAQIIDTWASSEWLDTAVAEWSMTGLQIRDMNVENGAFLDYPMTQAGAVVGDAAPSTVTIAISLRTGLSGRSFRGRLYAVGLGDTTFNGDYIDLTQRTLLINTYELLRAAFVVEDFTWVVASLYTNGAPRTNGLTTPITQITITDLIADSQRRRKPT